MALNTLLGATKISPSMQNTGRGTQEEGEKIINITMMYSFLVSSRKHMVLKPPVSRLFYKRAMYADGIISSKFGKT